MCTEVTFTMKELKRYGVIQAVMEKKMTTLEAAAALHLSPRQIKRIKKKVQQLGPPGVRHCNRGRRPPHAFPPEFRQHVVHLAKSRYHDFNFSHLSEILAEEEGIHINRESLRLWPRPERLGGSFEYERGITCLRSKNVQMGL